MNTLGTVGIALSVCLAGGVVTLGGAPAALAVPAATTPCAAGLPLESDFDGDGLAEWVVGATRGEATHHFLRPGDGGAGVWLPETGGVRAADLNGDLCADALLFEGGHEPWLKAALGTPDGLDVAGATDVTLPRAADVAGDPRRSLVFQAAGLRHDGLTQIVLSGRHIIDLEEEGPEPYGPFVDVLTLDGSLSLTAAQVLEVDEDSRRAWDFGDALAVSGRTIAVGHPSGDVGDRSYAGAVLIYTADAADPAHFGFRKRLTQNSAGVPGTAEAFDGFGGALAMRDGRLAIAATRESDGRRWSSGLVQPIRWNEATLTYKAYRAITQDTPGVPGSNEEGDEFGLDLAIARGLTATGSWDIVIGAAESYGSREDAGSVTVANFTRSLYRTWTQATKGMPGNPEEDDDFWHVSVARGAAGVDTVLIGAPGEDSGGVANVGRVVRSDGKKLTSRTTWTTVPVPASAPADLRHWGLDFGSYRRPSR